MLRLTGLVLLGMATALATGEANETECPFTVRIGKMDAWLDESRATVVQRVSSG
jgi:hypothetical protein